MRSLVSLAIPLLALLVLLTRIPVAQTAQLNRDLLWATVRVCVAAKRSMDVALPCQSVDLGATERLGTALLKVPGATTHFVLTPIGDLAGLEAPALQGPDGAQIFSIAWAARTAVVAASGRRLTLSDVGVAINSPMARSQDHLHIHLDCAAPQIRTALRDATVGAEWTWLPQPIGGRRYLARRVAASDLAALNPFVLLTQFPPAPKLILQSSLAAFPAPGGDVYLVADVRPNAMAELLLDHRCAS
jgi:CDP-diacylglycerol pyrophosphatase